MKYFKLAELTRSTTAQSKGIDNTPTEEQTTALEALVNRLLDPIRERWGNPITVNSGFRSQALNSAVGGVATSQHTKGEAADITAGSPQLNEELFNLIKGSGLDFDQLIDEYGYKWLHVSYRLGANRNQILHIS